VHTDPASLFVPAEGGSTFGYQGTESLNSSWEGPLRLSAYGTNELFGNQLYIFRIGYLHEIASRVLTIRASVRQSGEINCSASIRL
jgi:hypothetical protein